MTKLLPAAVPFLLPLPGGKSKHDSAINFSYASMNHVVITEDVRKEITSLCKLVIQIKAINAGRVSGYLTVAGR
jgi:hypothetical protein